MIKGVEGNVAILTDYDISGFLIALNIHGIHRIGIDLETLRYFEYDTDLQSLSNSMKAILRIKAIGVG